MTSESKGHFESDHLIPILLTLSLRASLPTSQLLKRLQANRQANPMIWRKLALLFDRLTRGSHKAVCLEDPSIQDNVSKQPRRQKRYFDKRNNVESQTLSRGQEVHLCANVRPDKYTPFWTATSCITGGPKHGNAQPWKHSQPARPRCRH